MLFLLYFTFQPLDSAEAWGSAEPQGPPGARPPLTPRPGPNHPSAGPHLSTQWWVGPEPAGQSRGPLPSLPSSPGCSGAPAMCPQPLQNSLPSVCKPCRGPGSCLQSASPAPEGAVGACPQEGHAAGRVRTGRLGGGGRPPPEARSPTAHPGAETSPTGRRGKPQHPRFLKGGPLSALLAPSW